MTAPVDRDREELAAALDDVPFLGPLDRARVRDALAPVVARREARAAAKALREAAHFLDDGADQAVEVALGGAAYVNRVLCNRAAALDTEGNTDE